jgi:hypothetical protein
MHNLSVITPGMLSRSLELRLGVNRFGRNPLNDHVFTDPSVSGFHCEVVVTNIEVVVQDLGSTNGTFINRQAIKESVLTPGQTLRLGQVEMMLDAPIVNIAIPELPLPEQEHANALPDGAAACQNHAQIRATLQCQKCQRTYCIDCVKLLGRAGGRKLRLCPACSGACEPMVSEDPIKLPKESILSRLSRSIRSTFQSR